MTLDDNSLLYYLLHGLPTPNQRVAQGFNQISPANARVANGFAAFNPPMVPTGGPGTFPVPTNGPQATPNARVANGFDAIGMPWLSQNNPSQGFPPAGPPVMAQGGGGGNVPLPQPRPAAAPQAQPQMNWFQHNAASMRDPVTGAFIDPQAASQSQAQGNPSLIKKFASLLFNKADNSGGGNSNPYANWGG